MARRKVSAGELRKMKKNREIREMKKKLKEALDDGSDEEYDVCAICDDGGSVTCCEGVCQRAFHLGASHQDDSDDDSEEHYDCREKLGLTLEQAQMIISTEEGFICKNCQYKQHQCFACGLLGSSDDTSSHPEVFQCEHGDCAHFYHPKCIAQLLYPDSEEAALLFEVEVAAAREKFTCPMHECMACKGVEIKNDRNMQFAVCRRCPTAYHRQCLPSGIIFKSRRGPNGLQRAWDDILPDRILIFCMKHKIVRDLRTPERNHLIFPKVNGVPAPETLEGEPMEQDVPEAPNQPLPSPEQTQPPPPPAASNQNQCSCSGPLTFAPSSLYNQPYPGSCGWIDD